MLPYALPRSEPIAGQNEVTIAGRSHAFVIRDMNVLAPLDIGFNFSQVVDLAVGKEFVENAFALELVE